MIAGDSGLIYTGMYRATVLKQENHGQLKLYVYGVTPKPIIEYKNNVQLIDDLPFAEPAISLFGGTGTTNGCISYPHVGATVWCFFENYDYMRPIYFAFCPAGEIYEKEYKVCQSKPELNKTGDFGIHKIIINNNILTIEEDSHVILDVIDTEVSSKYTRIDIIPNKTDITITDGSVSTMMTAIPGTVNITANVNINGTLTVSTDTITNNISFNNHVHTEKGDGADTSPPH